MRIHWKQSLNTAIENAERLEQSQASLNDLIMNAREAANARLVDSVDSDSGLPFVNDLAEREPCTTNRDTSGGFEFDIQLPQSVPPPPVSRYRHRHQRRLQARGGAGAATGTASAGVTSSTEESSLGTAAIVADLENLQATDWRPERYLGLQGSNRLLGGMTMMQYRVAEPVEHSCTDRFKSLEAPCFTVAAGNARPYGIDPVFRRSSVMYRSDLFGVSTLPRPLPLPQFLTHVAPNAEPVAAS
ncbi:hypothetical protein CYMTET_11381 [Cymbomonas tetramitiformis]|uniref:Uncharacterized protein n=1 Tax=Cymbomonas tetramitiformis TaxID=36881 RepID=A0AAE0LDI8_9CHLO|nr:hypothetical protein CYMTET_11381 [Cymbomonas tetramitiformis]